MTHFDFDAPADVFAGGSFGKRWRPLTFRRFQTGAEAIRYAVEGQSADKLIGTIVEVDDDRFGPEEIRSLYDSIDYPLPRRKSH